LVDASKETTGLNPGARNLSKMRLNAESFKPFQLQAIEMPVLELA